MAELLILVVIAGVVLLYAADRARKLRARARQMSAMNERLDVAAAKVDEQQERKQARVRASAELTSVLPAIKRPPLTLPGAPGPAAEPEDEPAAVEPEAGPAAEAAPAVADETPAATGTPATAEDMDTPDETPAADNPPATADDPAPADNPPALADAGNTPGDGAGAEESPGAQGAPEGTLTMGRVTPDATPAPKPQVTSDGTLIMPSVPGQGPAPAGEDALPPAPPRPRSGTGQSRTGQPSTSQEQASQD